MIPQQSEPMKLQRLQSHQYDDLAKLLHASLDVWHRTRLNVDRFGTEWEPFRLTVEVYEELDPGCCVVAMDDAGALMGSAFFIRARRMSASEWSRCIPRLLVAESGGR